MTRKKTLYAILVLILGYLTYLVYTLYLSPSANLRPVYLIPQDAVFLVETQEPVENWDKIRESEVWKHLQKNDYFSELTSNIQKVDTIFHRKKKLFELFGTRSLVFSIHMYRPKSYGIFYVVDLKKIAKLKLLKSYFNTLLDDNYVLSKRSYRDHEIIELYDKITKETLHISFIQNQLIASYVHTLVEASIDQHQEPAIGRDLDFIEIKKRTGYDDMFRLFVQYDYLDDYVRYFSDEKNDWARVVSETIAFSGFTLDLKSNNTIVANGSTNLNRSNIAYLKALQKSGISKRSAAEVIPKRSAIYMSFGFENFKELYSNFERLLQDDTRGYANYKENYRQIESLLKINIREHFMSWIGDEIAFLQIQPSVEKQTKNMALVLKTSNKVNAEENLGIMVDQIRKRTPVKFKQFTYKEHQINFLAIKGFFKMFFGGAFEKLEKPYFTMLEDYVVFSNEPETLKSIIDSYVASETLSTSEDYIRFNNKFRAKSSVFTYVNTPSLYKSMYAFADEKTKAQIQKNKDFIICFPQLGFQLTSYDGLFKSKLVVEYQNPELVASKEQFKMDDFYGPRLHTGIGTGTNAILVKDVFTVKSIFPDDLNADEYETTYKSGATHLKIGLKDGQKHGRYYEYYENGEVKVKGRFKQDKQVGTWRHYDLKGNLIKKKKF
ncbi:MAG: DUF3352 domain-containing protein [Flavobacteriaceae bacterium]|nr:DUF3352 domain-containing protein [Flavobacteriaceae bacterium]